MIVDDLANKWVVYFPKLYDGHMFFGARKQTKWKSGGKDGTGLKQTTREKEPENIEEKIK